MTKLNLEDLGLSQDEIADRIVERAAERMLFRVTDHDEDGEPLETSSEFRKVLEKRIAERIDQAVESIAAKHVLPNVEDLVETITLQETNKWGEKRGEPVTFKEYLVKRAEEYLTEKVDYQGKTKAQGSGFSWNGTQTRITHLIHQHLHYSIESAMKEALANANSAIVKGLQETTKQKLSEISQKLSVSVKTR